MGRYALIVLAGCWLCACADTELFGLGSSDGSTTESVHGQAVSGAGDDGGSTRAASSSSSDSEDNTLGTSGAAADDAETSAATSVASTEASSSEASDTSEASSDDDSGASTDATEGTETTETSSGSGEDTGDSQCHDEQIVCDGVCIYPQSDPRYCGAQGNCLGSNAGVQCPTGHRCRMGECKLYCSGRTIDCNGECVYPDSDARYCGASGDCMGINAGEACSAGEFCSLGVCGLRPDWSEPTTLDEFDHVAYVNLRGVFTARDGQPAVVWDLENRLLARSYKTADDRWTPAADGGSVSSVVGVVPDGRDGLVAVWLVGDVAHWNRYLIKNDRWQFATGQPFVDVANASHREMELNGQVNGRVSLVYADPSFEQENILFHDLEGNVWSEAQQLAPESRHVHYVQAESGEGSSLMVTWRHYDLDASARVRETGTRGNALVLYSRSRNRAGNWGPVRELRTEGAFQYHRKSILGWAGGDRWLACWFEFPVGGMHGTPHEAHCSRHMHDGRGWSDSKMVLTESLWSELYSTGPGQLALLDQRGGMNLRWFEGLDQDSWRWTDVQKLSTLQLGDVQLRRTPDDHLYLVGLHTSGPMGTARRSYVQQRAAGADAWGLLFNLDGTRRPAKIGISGDGRALLVRTRLNADNSSIVIQWHRNQ